MSSKRGEWDDKGGDKWVGIVQQDEVAFVPDTCLSARCFNSRLLSYLEIVVQCQAGAKSSSNPSFNVILALCVKHTNGDGSQPAR